MGPNYSISTACATSNFCILNAANHIIKGEAVSIPLQHLLVGYLIFFPTICLLEVWDSYMVILLNDIKSLSLPLQDMMLCGGSDAAIIPIGILFSPNLFGLHEVILSSM